MLTKFLSKSILVATALSLSVACVQMNPEQSGPSGSQSSGNSGPSASGGTNKSFNTAGLLNSKRTPSGRIALNFTNKRSIDVSHIVNNPSVATVSYSNQGNTLSVYETGAPFRQTVKSHKSGGEVTMVVTFDDGSTQTYKL